MTKHTKTFQYGGRTVTIETGATARQASGAVLISMDDTVVLCTTVGVKEEEAISRDFFPLTVNYQERTYAAGKFPGGFMKREGRPSIKETLTSRLIDRPLRPTFPKGFTNEVQIIATVMSMNTDVDPDIPALIGAAAALAVSGIPFNGPVAAARVGYKDGQYLLNPTPTELETSALNLVVAGTEKAVLMVESEAKRLSEDVMLGAVLYGHEQMQTAIQAIKELATEVGTAPWEWTPKAVDEGLQKRVVDSAEQPLTEAYQIADKMQRYERINALRAQVIESLCPTNQDEMPLTETVKSLFADLEKRIVRSRILANQPRIDGRDLRTIRPINIEVGILPRTHGSAHFTRGETQAIVVTTLGTDRDAQIIDIPAGEYRESFMLHYNFPPYSVGEVGFMGSPKRRELGHGYLAKRALSAVIPDPEDFPYVLRVVSEITESNGSSSMATVCGTTLSLMDAGVPVKAPVAGIAMGLIKEGDQFAVLTDILGDEDHLGDMDFKVAGTQDGVTALQMDIKIDGITKEIMEKALAQANEARLSILEKMNTALEKPRDTISDYAPRIITMRIKPDKIRDVIGKGGSVIRSITEETGATIDINDDGIINIAAVDVKAGEAAQRRIRELTTEPEIGQIYEGKVIKIMEFGAFVNIMPGTDGLVHISQIANERINRVEDYLKEGEAVRVKILDIDRQGRIRLSIRAVEAADVGNDTSD